MSKCILVSSVDKTIEVSGCGTNVNVSGTPGRAIIIQGVGSQGPPGNGALWGDIGGVLSDQTDLQLVLDSKLTAQDSDIVNQAKAGNKVLSGNPLSLITIADNATFTNNTKVLSYSSGKLSSVVHAFDYNSQTWTFTSTYSYTGEILTGITETINKV